MELLWWILGLLAIVTIFLYNALVHSRNRAKEAWSDIEVQLKRRYDLIPNLVETVKGYATHERDVLEEVARLRAVAADTHGSPEQKATSENGLQEGIKTLFAVSESYPDLKANQNFLELQDDLVDTENKIQAARRFYNSNVRELNTRVDLFPTNLIAGIFRFKKMEFFELADDKERDVVSVGSTLRKG